MEKYKSYCSEKNGKPRNLITDSKGTLLKNKAPNFDIICLILAGFKEPVVPEKNSNLNFVISLIL